MNVEILKKGCQSLPYTLAHPLHGMATQAENGNWSGAMNYMLDFFETSTMYLSIVLLACAAAAFLAKKDHKKLMLVSAVVAAMLFWVFTGLIGVCASDTMRCQSTALWGKIAAAVAFAASLVELFSGKEGQIPD